MRVDLLELPRHPFFERRPEVGVRDLLELRELIRKRALLEERIVGRQRRRDEQQRKEEQSHAAMVSMSSARMQIRPRGSDRGRKTIRVKVPSRSFNAPAQGVRIWRRVRLGRDSTRGPPVNGDVLEISPRFFLVAIVGARITFDDVGVRSIRRR